MFRNTRGGGRDIFPTSGNGRSGGGGSMYGAARDSKPAISKSFIATIFWALMSLALIAGGWTYCSRRLESTAVKCDAKGCKIAELTNGVTKVLTIPRMHMIRAEMVRVKNGAIVDASKLRRSAQRKLGHTYAVVYTELDSEDDDDESYDSFEDDDDSYDSYDDDQDSSADDDDDDDDYDGPRSAQGGGKPGQRANTPPARKPAVKTAKSSKSVPKPLSEAEKQAAIEKKEADRKAYMEKKAAQRERFAEERRSLGKEPIREPDEQKARPERREAGQRPMDDDEHDSDERFPGDAGTMEERNRDQIAQMEAAQRMASKDHREKSRKAYEEASRKHQDKQKLGQQTKQMGNSLHDRKRVSPDDPDSRQPPPEVEQKEDERPKLERGEAQKDLSDAKDGSEEAAVDAAADMDEEIKGLQERLEQLQKEAEMRKAGGRTISSVGGLESVDEDHLSGEDEARREGLPAGGEAEAEAGILEGGQEYDTLGEFIHAGAAGARRKLLAWKNRVKKVDTPAAKRTREEIDRDAAKARESHRSGHGHHQKRAKKVAATVKDEVGATPPQKGAIHHHKAFHHKKEAPAEDRHHVHPGFHHRPGEQKIEGGWKHQNRQWHGRSERKKLATSYNLGRSKSRKRKEAIDSYVSRRSHSVDFVDSKKWRAVGLWMMIVGCISASFCIIVGNFQPRPKTKKVS